MSSLQEENTEILKSDAIQMRKKDLFTQDEEESDHRHFFENTENGVKNENGLSQKRKTQIPKAHNSIGQNVILKTKNKLIGDYNLSKEIGLDQVQFESLNVDMNDEASKLIQFENEVPKERFNKFLSAKENMGKKETHSNEISRDIFKQIGNFADFNEDDFEIQLTEPTYKTSFDAIAKNTEFFKQQIEEGTLLQNNIDDLKNNKINDFGTPIIRSKEDLIKMYNHHLMGKTKMATFEKEKLASMFKKITYEDIETEKRKKQLAEEEQEAIENDEWVHDEEENDISYDSEENILDDDPDASLDSHEKKIEAENRENEFLQANHEIDSKDQSFDDFERQNEQIGSNVVQNCSKVDEMIDEQNKMIDQNSYQEKSPKIEEIGKLMENNMNFVHENKSEDLSEEHCEENNPKSRLKSIRAHITEKEEIRKKEKEIKRKINERNEKIAKKVFFETEAELGSDNELNDNMIKIINKDNDSEKEDAEMDKSDEELIQRDPIELIPENELRAGQKFLEDMIKADEEEMRKIESGIFFQKAQANQEAIFQRKDEIEERKSRMLGMLQWLENKNSNMNLNNDTKVDKSIKTHTYGLNVFDEEEENNEVIGGVRFSATEFLQEMNELKKLREKDKRLPSAPIFSARVETKSFLPISIERKIRFSQVDYKELAKHGAKIGTMFYSSKDQQQNKDLYDEKME